ncbi:hypothetical protein KK092_08195 [Curtobacterium flaccumfaciens pv. flaccumfaciens]|uniref:hypothetical protein n=1 Tax=Curtobacterium flaccumfaciens TaxID=2035 RepID=UPI001BDE13AA|nr:hypothetical protein [Curtobacterium flaccumfaciens]MBT1669358.1 hypothetical protein [Curtobacterium flaccumfaciens pv. flaccumfaciens]
MDTRGSGRRSARITSALVSVGGLVVAMVTGAGLWLGHGQASTSSDTSTSSSADTSDSSTQPTDAATDSTSGSDSSTGSGTTDSGTTDSGTTDSDTGVSQGTTGGASDTTTTGS